MAKLNRVTTDVVTNAPAADINAGSNANEPKVATPLYIPAVEDQNKELINKLAIVLGIPAVRLQSAQVAYKPIEGLPYDPKRINWANVSAFIARRLDKVVLAEGVEVTVENVYKEAIRTKYEAKRFGRAASGESVYGKVIFGTTPLRKGNVQVGTKIYSRKDGAEFDVIFVNDTIVVYEPTHKADEKVVSEAIGNRMFNMNFVFEPIPATATAATKDGDKAPTE